MITLDEKLFNEIVAARSKMNAIPNGGYYDFPHTNYYDGDLGWLIRFYLEIAQKYISISETVSRLEELITTIPEQVQQAMQEAMVDVYNTLADIKSEVDNKLADMTNQLDSMQNTLNNWTLALAKLESYVNSIEYACNAYADSKDAYWVDYIKTYINSIAKVWPPVKCPADGNMEDINTALEHIYHSLAYTMTYYQFDQMTLTYDEFNALSATYSDLNIHANKLLEKYDPRFYMFSPLTGLWTKITDVIWELYRLHVPGGTYNQFNALGLTFDEFNAKNWTYQKINEGFNP